jgi:DNA-binding NtrC family response regulator
MTTIRILVIDDRWGRDLLAQRELIDRAKPLESSNPKIEIAFDFLSSQRLNGNALINDLDLAVDAVREHPDRWSLVLLDMQFDYGNLDIAGEPELSDPTYGLRIERALLECEPDLPLVRFTSTHEKELSGNPRPYLSKLDQSADAIRLALVQHGRFANTDLELQIKSALLRVPKDTVVHSASMLNVYADAYRYAQSSKPILILGESGTGKEHLARYIHSVSQQPKEPFIGINLAAIPAELFETTLFGHEKGAFSGASSSHDGVFTRAGKGTVFLDEIGAAASLHQTKMLRALQERRYTKVGGGEEIEVSCTIVAATQDDIRKATQEGTFRADLYNRFVQKLYLPPLRERTEEIPALTLFMLAKAQKSFDKQGIAIAEETLQALMRHPLPKNARSVESAIDRAVSRLASNSVIRKFDLDLEPTDIDSMVGTTKREPYPMNLDKVASRPSALPTNVHMSWPPHALESEGLGHDQISPLLNQLASQRLSAASPELPGLLAHMNSTLDHLRREMAYAALQRCRHPVTGKIKILPAMQLLTGDHTLSAMNAKRLLNNLLGRNQATSIGTTELENEMACRNQEFQTNRRER